MKSPRNPWQELLETAIRTKVAPPRPEGFLTIKEISKQWNQKKSCTSRHLLTLVAKKKVEVIRHQCLIETRTKPMLRKLKMYRIIPTKHPHK